jgi:GNAT superfamily N-acetyltransferase
LGCISYKKINPTTVEMNRLAVDSGFRGMKIGRKIVQSLIDVAKENGYGNMYLETSGPYGTKWDALYLYEKMNFKYLRSMGFSWPGCIFGCFTSIRVVSYIYLIE